MNKPRTVGVVAVGAMLLAAAGPAFAAESTSPPKKLHKVGVGSPGTELEFAL